MASSTGPKLTDNQISDIIEIVLNGATVEYPGGDGIVLYALGRTIRDIQEYLESQCDEGTPKEQSQEGLITGKMISYSPTMTPGCAPQSQATLILASE